MSDKEWEHAQLIIGTKCHSSRSEDRSSGTTDSSSITIKPSFNQQNQDPVNQDEPLTCE